MSSTAVESLVVQRQALTEIRKLLGQFVKCEVEPAEFIPRYQCLFAPFDAPDPSAGEPSTAEQNELTLYIRFFGGWFGEEDELIPRRADWEYGKSEAAYSWIDAGAYRSWIRRETAELGIEL